MRTLRLAALGLLSLTLTACGAGFSAETYEVRALPGGTNDSVGDVDIRNLSVLPPGGGASVYEEGEDARASLTLASGSADGDALVEVTTPAADEVTLVEGEALAPTESIEVPPFGSTDGGVQLVIRGLAEELRTGEYVEMTLRFERSGSITVQVPVALTGTYDDTREHSENFHEIGEEH